MKTLAADTTTSINTVALCDGDRVLAETFVDCGRKHSERLIATVDWLLKEAGVTLDDVQALAISIGPGSFTGLRVGAAAWKGLAFAKNLPLVAVPTLDAMTRLSIFRNAVVCPLIDAKMGEVFGAVYQFTDGVRAKSCPDRVCPVEDILEGLAGEVLFLGDGSIRYRERIEARVPGAIFAPSNCSLPRASAVAVEAAHLMAHGANTDPALAAPIYLREAQAAMPRKPAATQ
jgi:tRNA threonylcarbamoyladenosine biosynthesis protein TsaB